MDKTTQNQQFCKDYAQDCRYRHLIDAIGINSESPTSDRMDCALAIEILELYDKKLSASDLQGNATAQELLKLACKEDLNNE